MSRSPAESTVGMLVITGERQGYLTASLLSSWMVLRRRFGVVCIVDTGDSGLRRRNRRLAGRLARRVIVVPARGVSTHRAIRLGIDALVEEGVTLALSVEEDFVILSRTAVERALTLASDGDTLQVCLMRQRWFGAEFGYRSMGEYLVRRRGGVRDGDGLIAIAGYFTANPSAFVPHVVHSVLADVAPSDAYDFELDIGATAGRRGLPTTVLEGRSPHVLHIGAVSTSRLRARHLPVPFVYLAVHASRARTVLARLARQSIRGVAAP